jgi:DNA-binding IclR family transcriptional regulator
MSEIEIVSPANAIERVIGVVEMLAVSEVPLRLSEIAQQFDIPKSAVHRILSSLSDRGWVEQGHNDSYALTLRMPLLGQRMLAMLGGTNLRQPILDRLATETRELVRLTELRNEELVWIGSARGRRSGLVYEADMTERIVPFATANGKVWLATLPPERAIRIARDAGLGTLTGLPNTVRDISGLLGELEATRRRGYGLALEEAEEGVAAIAVGIGDAKGLVATMSVAAPIGRLGPDKINQLVPVIKLAAQSMMLIWNTPMRNALHPTTVPLADSPDRLASK